MSRLRLSSFALLACLVLLIASLGCSSQTGPETATESNSTALDLTHPRNFDDEDLREPFEFEAVKNPVFVRVLSPSGGPGQPARAQHMQQNIVERDVGVTGGIVSNTNASLYIPASALTEQTTIHVETESGDDLIVDCGPDGLEFNVPVFFYLNLEGTDYEGRAHLVDILWLDETKGTWMLIKQLPDLDENHPGAVIEHFSKYSGVGG